MSEKISLDSSEKNIQCGEGGLLIINDERLVRRSEIIWEKGTNRAEFYRGEVNKYGWVDLGSSFYHLNILLLLYSQLCELEKSREEELIYGINIMRVCAMCIS